MSGYIHILRRRFWDGVFLEESDLNPENSYCSKDYYYYSSNGVNLQIEEFVYGDGYGLYVKFDYFLSQTGDTLTMVHENSTTVYVKYDIPNNWKKYPVNW